MACVFIYKWESNKNIYFNKLDKNFSRICSTQVSLIEWWKFFMIGTLITYKELLESYSTLTHVSVWKSVLFLFASLESLWPSTESQYIVILFICQPSPFFKDSTRWLHGWIIIHSKLMDPSEQRLSFIWHSVADECKFNLHISLPGSTNT